MQTSKQRTRGQGQAHLAPVALEPEMRAAIGAAQKLDMNMCAHIDYNVVTIQKAIKFGVKHFEHAYTPVISVFNYREHWSDFDAEYRRHFENRSFWTQTLEIFRFVHKRPALRKQYIALLDEMAEIGGSLCSTIHLFGSIVGRTAHRTLMQTRAGNEEKFDDLTAEQLSRLNEDFDLLMSYYKTAHEKGVTLRLGTDCMNGGRAALSEMLLLYEAGFSITDILQIATINGARALELDDQYGSLERGKKADLVLFDQSPFEDSKHFLSGKTVIKDGVIYTY